MRRRSRGGRWSVGSAGSSAARRPSTSITRQSSASTSAWPRRSAAGASCLLGDATHINSLIGIGMNGDIHDAWFLADCLARVPRGEASETVLDSWAEVRRRIALDVVRAETHRMTETLGRTGAAIRAQRNDEFARLAADPASRASTCGAPL